QYGNAHPLQRSRITVLLILSPDGHHHQLFPQIQGFGGGLETGAGEDRFTADQALVKGPFAYGDELDIPIGHWTANLFREDLETMVFQWPEEPFYRGIAIGRKIDRDMALIRGFGLQNVLLDHRRQDEVVVLLEM